jgi:hypothetical protein
LNQRKKKKKTRFELPKSHLKSSYTNEYIETVIEDLEESKNLKQELMSGMRKNQTEDKKVTFAKMNDENKVNHFSVNFLFLKTTSERKSKRDTNRSEDFGYLPKSLTNKKLNMNNSFSFQAVFSLEIFK